MRVKNRQEFVDQIVYWLRARVQVIHVVAGGEQRLAEKLIFEAYRKARTRQNESPPDIKYAVWDSVQGLHSYRGMEEGPLVDGNVQGSEILVNALNALKQPADKNTTLKSILGEDACVIFRDPMFELNNNPRSQSGLKEMIKENLFGERTIGSKTYKRCGILLSNSSNLSPELIDYVRQIELPLPRIEEIPHLIDDTIRDWPGEVAKPLQQGGDKRELVSRSLIGLSSSAIADVLSEVVVRHRGVTDQVYSTIERQKVEVLGRNEALTYVPFEAIQDMPDLSGYERLTEWIEERKCAYRSEAEGLNLDMPKGISLIGVPGTGKSMACKYIAKQFKLPLIRFDIGAVFNSLVGETERRTREALALAGAMEGCVFMIDEADKVLGNADQASGDSGVTRRMFGQILTWMAEKNDRTFVVMTMNRVQMMPPELLRRGRMDEVFYVDLPADIERKQIMETHMRRRQIDPTRYSASQWEDLVSITKEYVGAEIEDVVKAARFKAFASNVNSKAVPTFQQLMDAARQVVPLSRGDRENIEQIRTFCSERAVPVSQAQLESVSNRVSHSRKGKSTRGLDVDTKN